MTNDTQDNVGVSRDANESGAPTVAADGSEHEVASVSYMIVGYLASSGDYGDDYEESVHVMEVKPTKADVLTRVASLLYQGYDVTVIDSLARIVFDASNHCREWVATDEDWHAEAWAEEKRHRAEMEFKRKTILDERERKELERLQAKFAAEKSA